MAHIFDTLDEFAAAIAPGVLWSYDCRRTVAIDVDFRLDGRSWGIRAKGADGVARKLDYHAQLDAIEELCQ